MHTTIHDCVSSRHMRYYSVLKVLFCEVIKIHCKPLLYSIHTVSNRGTGGLDCYLQYH